MTAKEALWLIKVTLQKNEQNLEAIRVLEDIVKSVNRVHIDDNEKTYTLEEAKKELDINDYGTEAKHILNHIEKNNHKDS